MQKAGRVRRAVHDFHPAAIEAEASKPTALSPLCNQRTNRMRPP